MSMIRSPILRAVRATASRRFGSTNQLRHYANKENMSADQGQGSPGTASNVVEPGSVSADQQNIKKSRGVESEGSPDTKSVQKPLDNPKGARTAQQEDDTSTQEAFKQDPNKSDAEKRKNVDKQGQKPLEAADK